MGNNLTGLCVVTTNILSQSETGLYNLHAL